MVIRIKILGAAALALGLAAGGVANAQTPQQHHPKQKSAKLKAQGGHDVTVHNATPSWLTLGPDANSRAASSYATDTFDQASPIQGTFTGMRGREQLIDRFGAGGATLFNF